MTNQKSKPLTAVAHVYETTDYQIFKTLQGNRDVNPVHVRRLVNSFREAYLFSPILVNERMEVIDGQHRLKAAIETEKPIRYIVRTGYGLNEVQRLNANSSNWKKIDYLKAYCDLGYHHYLVMRDFMEEFPDFGIKTAEMMLTDTMGGANNKRRLGGKFQATIKGFENGEFEVKDLDYARDCANKILMMKPHYDGFTRPAFVGAMVQLFRNENYNHSQLLARLTSNPGTLVHCANVTQYKLLIEEIYNFRSREKVSLRF